MEKNPEAILDRLVGWRKCEVLEKNAVSLSATVQKSVLPTAIIALGGEEIDSMIEEKDHGAGEKRAANFFCGNQISLISLH